MIEFIGRFHPLIVHLPIGILLIAIAFYWLSKKAKYQALLHAVPLLLLAGAASALFSCISGYMLNYNGDYDEDLANQHMWMGILVTVLSTALYLQFVLPKFSLYKTVTVIALIVAITITGHLGGSLTHGADYLSAPLADMMEGGDEQQYKIAPIANPQEAKVYSDVVKPILQTKCYSCHNESKQKGSLRMDDSLLLMKGGKHGKIIDLKDLSASALLERINLPADNEKHMPPKQKPQLSENQVALLHWWVSDGASFTKKTKELPQDDKIKKALAALQQSDDEDNRDYFASLPDVEKGNAKAIEQLKAAGAIVNGVTRNSNYLDINFVTKPMLSEADFNALKQLSKQILQLNLRGTNCNDQQLGNISGFNNLVRIDLSNTKITDAGITALKDLQQLKSLNVTSTAISEKGLHALANCKALQHVYAYNTSLNKTAVAQLKKEFPKTQIDTGGYVVAILPTDTTMLKTDY